MSFGGAVLVSGGRDTRDAHHVSRELDALDPALVIVGDCPTGVDLFARAWCASTGTPCLVGQAHWGFHANAAGPKRNAAMADAVAALGERLPTLMLAFPGGRGTADCIRAAKRAGLEVREVGA